MSRRRAAPEPRRPTKHGFICTDHDPIEDWQPEDPDYVDCFVDIYLGPDDAPSGEFFTVRIVTHRALADIKGPKKKRHVLVLPSYSWSLAEAEIDAVLDKCKGRDWPEMCDKLRRYFRSEFEGMIY